MLESTTQTFSYDQLYCPQRPLAHRIGAWFPHILFETEEKFESDLMRSKIELLGVKLQLPLKLAGFSTFKAANNFLFPFLPL